MELAYRILNVFTVAGQRLSGNPLCVFEDGRGLDEASLQALARQLNLSETTFILPPTRPEAAARVRVFTPDVEMPFAGHPTLGTAAVVRAMGGAPGGLAAGRVVLELAAGLVPVEVEGSRFTLTTAYPPRTRAPAASAAELAAMAGLPPGAVARPLWVDAGVEQLLLPVRSVAELEAARPSAEGLLRHGRAAAGAEPLAYLFAEAAPGEVVARCFFLAGGAVVEDPATGSACANLGGWLLAAGAAPPLRRVVHQGRAVQRPSRLELEVTSAGSVRVSGEVVELGRGLLVI